MAVSLSRSRASPARARWRSGAKAPAANRADAPPRVSEFPTDSDARQERQLFAWFPFVGDNSSSDGHVVIVADEILAVVGVEKFGLLLNRGIATEAIVFCSVLLVLGLSWPLTLWLRHANRRDRSL
jgi:hypothetical protein